MIEPTPTKRAVIEPLLQCNTKCKFCYHLHKFDNWESYTKTLPQVETEILKAKERGNNYIDFTGGEPTIYHGICDAVQFALINGMKSCIITNGIVGPKRADNIIAAGIDDFLISIHGMEETHNNVVNCKYARKWQHRFITQLIANKMSFRFNCVIHKFNQNEIKDIALFMLQYNPRIVNFINFNPHHDWKNNELQAAEVIADLRLVEPQLNEAIEILEDNGIGVNLRYYPMCRISPKHYKNICNDLQVMFDPYEWDYNTTPKDYKTYKQWGINTSKANEKKDDPCNTCELRYQCGGINKHFHKISSNIYPEVCTPTIPELKDFSDDFYYFRQHNTKTLEER